MSKPHSELTTSQKGTIAEYFAATALMAASDGRLSPFVPLADDHGIDLLVLDKQNGHTLALQVKSWIKSTRSKRRTVQFDVRKATFRHDSGTALLAIILDPYVMAMETAWLIPMGEVPNVANERVDKYALTPSRSVTSRDRYSVYRHQDASSLAEALFAMNDHSTRL